MGVVCSAFYFLQVQAYPDMKWFWTVINGDSFQGVIVMNWREEKEGKNVFPL